MLRKLFALVCLVSLSACGLKGPLYMPEKAQEAAPMSTPAPATQTAPEADGKL